MSDDGMVEVTAVTSFAGLHYAMQEGQTKFVTAEQAREWLRLGWVRSAIHSAATALADATAPTENNSNEPVAQARRGRPKKNN